MIKKFFLYPPIIAAISATICISIIAFISENTSNYILWIIPTFGASVVLITALPSSPLARPRNILFGHLISAGSGVAIGAIFGVSFFTIGVAVGVAILIMMMTDKLHPPAGGNPILVMSLGLPLEFNVLPLAAGVIIILVYAIIFNKIIMKRDYPWF
jgi:CBS-domain-containing membrane protein|tara:strand:- start:43 stop:513 length:471 start_codon:yes stop_codon:yes gene_type:complete